MFMEVAVSEIEARQIAAVATKYARQEAPKMSGASAGRIVPFFRNGIVGVRWMDAHLWYQEVGTNPFTMRSLAGKTIPMWIDDPTGEERRKNPKAATRITASGKSQVLIFRRAAPIGQRKLVRRGGVMTDVPASYPGAPGRIAVREAPAPYTTPGKIAGAVARTNVGVRWRHPGLSPRGFLAYGLHRAVVEAGLEPRVIHVAFGPKLASVDRAA